MAFGADGAPARTRLDSGRERRGAGDCRRALGALSAVRRSRPHRRRRGARGRLQAGGRRHLQRARHGGGARAVREGADCARFRDAGDRDPLQRRERTLPLAPPPHTLRPGAAARNRLGRPQARRSAARPVARAARGRRCRGGEEPRRAGDAVPQSARIRAPHAMPSLRASVRMSQLLGLAGRASFPGGARLPSLRPCREPA